MASQRNNITLPELNVLLKRTIMNESQIVLEKLDVVGNDLSMSSTRFAGEATGSVKMPLKQPKERKDDPRPRGRLKKLPRRNQPVEILHSIRYKSFKTISTNAVELRASELPKLDLDLE
ncbi:hypothetical protein BD770DRAFT_405592 [Pilaira anomala]|nr:hypothetical protein BD770DRAFT_405592 [Pilaira anomala]